MNNITRFKRHQIVFLNGPRHSGKDTAANFIMSELPAETRHEKFSRPLKLAASALYGLNQGLYRRLETPGSDFKTEKLTELFGWSWVDTLIWLSEECVKKRIGQDAFGLLMLGRIAKPTTTQVTVISDCGFAAEVLPIIKMYGVPNCHVFRIYREGYTFAGDSRGYLFENDLPEGLHIEDIHNVYDKSMFRVQILRRIDKILGRQVEYVA